MAIPENYIDKITKDGDSRDICPAADKVRVGNENFDGTDLDSVLNEIAEEMDNAGYTPPAGGIPKTDLAPSVQQTLDDVANKVDKVPGKGLSTNDYTTEEKAKLAGLPTNPVQSISVNGTAQQKDANGNVNIEVEGGGLTKEDISVETQGDGTVDINVGSGANKDTYTINLNHTHENMAKLIVCEESDLPSTLDNSTIYAITDSGETEIKKLIIRGMEFAGGGVPDTGEPMISSPSNGSTINLGDNTAGQGVSKTITIKGKNLTGDITVAVGTGLTISYGQSIGQSSVTIPMAQALLGAQVTIAYSGSGALDDGSLVISHGGSVLSSVVVVVVVVPVPTTLTAIKLTGSQWLQTDYKPNANTEFELDVKFSGFSSSVGQIMFDCAMNTIADTAKLFRMYYIGSGSAGIKFANEESITNPNTHNTQNVSNDAVNGTRGIIKYVKESGHGTFSCGSSSVETTLKSSTMENALKIGHGRTTNAGADAISNFTEFVIYGFVITENGTTVRNYVPATLNGVPGLHDTVTGAFISSETSTPVVAIE